MKVKNPPLFAAKYSFQIGHINSEIQLAKQNT